MISLKRTLLRCVVASAMAVAGTTMAVAQVNKSLVEKAPKEEPAVMPHVVPGDPTKMRIRQDKSTNIWREWRDQNGQPKRDPGPIDIQRYNLQMEPVGIKTFFQLPVALNPEDLYAKDLRQVIVDSLHPENQIDDGPVPPASDG